MKTPYLVQRLRKPYKYNELPAELASNYKTGYECTPEERVAINDILLLDYMGSAEYEFGEFPKAMRKLADTKSTNKVITWELTGKPRGIFSDEVGTEVKTILYLIIPQDIDNDELKKFILEQSDYTRKVHLKERSELCQIFGRLNRERSKRRGKDGKYAIKYTNKEADVVGWLDLCNYWFATTDEKMFNVLKGLVYVNTPTSFLS